MTIAFVEKAAVVGSGLTVTLGNLGVSSGADRAVVAGVIVDGAAAPTGVTCNGAAMTQMSTGINNGNLRASLWYIANPVSGNATIIATWAASVTSAKITGSSWTGVNQTTPMASFVSATGTSAAPSVAATNASGNVAIDEAIGAGASGVFSGGSGTPLTAAQRNGSQYNEGVNPTMSWVCTSAAWAICAASIQASTTVSPPITGGVTVSSGELRIVPLRGAPWGFSKQQDPATRNMIVNGDFEVSTNIQTTFTDGDAADTWYPYAGGTIAISTAGGAAIGSRALRCITTGTGQATGLYLSLSSLPSGTYTFRAWVKPASGKQVTYPTTSGPYLSPAGDGTWHHITANIIVGTLGRLAFVETAANDGDFYVDGAEMYATPAMTENNAAALEASGQYPKVLAGTIQPGGEIIWDDIYTLPSVAPAGLIEVSAMPTRNSPHGSLIVTTQDKIAVYPLPFGPEPGDDPILATSRSDASASTDLVPVFYPAAIDFGTALYELLGVQCIGQDFIDEEDSWAMSYCWGTTAEWEVVRRLAQSHAVFYPAGRSIGSYLRTAVSIYDASDTDPVGPSGRHIICWVRQVDESGNAVKQADRASPEPS